MSLDLPAWIFDVRLEGCPQPVLAPFLAPCATGSVTEPPGPVIWRGRQLDPGAGVNVDARAEGQEWRDRMP